MTANNAWGEHVTAALLGTERRPPPVLPGVSPGEGVDPAGRLLDQAAVLAAANRAGRRPPGEAEPIAPAPAEHLPPPPAEAAHRLARILAGERVKVLPEWLNAAADHGFRVPSRMLPELLERGRGDRGLRPAIARAAGRRGVWLALQNTDWAYLVGAGDDPGGDAEVWEIGTRAQRVAYLTRLRGTDPAAARAALAETWSREPAPDRAAFLATFEHGLSAGDEEFLENALEDRGKDVRQLASDLLSRLPGSAYGLRMAARALRCVRPERHTVQGREGTWVTVDLPEGHDEEMARDGIPFHPSGSFAPERAGRPVGTQAAWLREILSRTPLSTWTELFGAPPAEIVCLPVGAGGEADGRSARDVHTGWARAAVRQREAGWARALLRSGVLVDEPDALADLLTVLPEDERSATAADLIRWGESRTDVLRVLRQVPGPWTGPLADAVIATIAMAFDGAEGDADCASARRAVGSASARGSGGSSPQNEADLRRFRTRLCDLAEERLSPSAAPRLARLRLAGGGGGGALGSPVLAELIDSLNFRHEMLKELAQ